MTRSSSVLAALCLSVSFTSACTQEMLQATTAIAKVSGSICDDKTKRFVPDAKVTLTVRTFSGTVLSQHDGMTDALGHFDFERIANGKHILRVEKGTFVQELEITVTSSKDVVLPEASCELPMGMVTGRICDVNTGDWVAGAEIYVAGPKGAVTAAAPTAADGSFSLSGVPAGPRDVIATAPNGKKIAVPVNVVPEGTVDLGVHDCVQVGKSNIEGQICANTSGNWLANAKVSVKLGGSTFSDLTDAEGRFVLRGLAAGTYDVVAEKGAYKISFQATTTENKTTFIPEPKCTAGDIPVVVVSGFFDAVQKVMKRLHFQNVTIFKGHDGYNEVIDLKMDRDGSWSAQLLDGAAPEIFNYKIAMFNSGLDEADLGVYGSAQYNRRIQNLRRYVEEGGFVYVSDWAYDLIAGSFGSPLSFRGNGQQDSAQEGMLGYYDAQVTEPNLTTLLGSNLVKVNMRVPQWAVVQSVSPDVKVYAKADVLVPPESTPEELEGVPLLMSFSLGKGRVVFSSFQTKDQTSAEIDTMMDFLVFEL
ncbi:MAG: carboxypeptidase regulatory-like domain-containing protein [Deltaproteobacteria bacterium]|nr:carboxypeptidase regulatory-like domain-containing protein [Deltaproteobacteria bacterium]